MANKKTFLTHFWKEKKMVGAMSPSSKYLAAKMLESIDFKTTKIIVELGPGTGVFTKRILEKMQDDAVLYVFELNTSFYQSLCEKITDSRVKILHESAENLNQFLAEHEFGQVDVIVSSLPLSNFPNSLRTSILQAAHDALRINGQYIQFQYSLQSKKLLRSFFKEMSIDFTAINFPPAFVYRCQKID